MNRRRLCRYAIVVSAMIALLSAPARAQMADCTAEVAITAAPSLTLDIAYRCRTLQEVSFRAVGPAARAFVSGARDRRGRAVAEQEGSWQVPSEAGEAQLFYRLDLGALARSREQIAIALSRGGAVMALLGSWLLQPHLVAVATPSIDIEVQSTAPGLKFAAGLPRAGAAWRLAGTTPFFAGYTTIGAFDLHELRLPAGAVGGAQGDPQPSLRLAILPGDLALPSAELVDWVQRTALAQSHFWDGFPAPGALVTLVPRHGLARVGFGRVVPGGGVTMAVEIGSAADRAALYGDWVLMHEFVHTAMPFVTGRANWLMEGAATWLEPIVRARAGWKSEAEVWREWISDMPRGVAGLEQGGGSGRLSPYWSGALLLLLADIEIRRSGSAGRGLEDCLRQMLHEGARGTQRWPLERYVARCDALLGGSVLADHVRRFIDRGESVDLAALWRQLGVALEAGQVHFDETAPLAAIRRQMVLGNRPPRRVALPAGL